MCMVSMVVVLCIVVFLVSQTIAQDRSVCCPILTVQWPKGYIRMWTKMVPYPYVPEMVFPKVKGRYHDT